MDLLKKEKLKFINLKELEEFKINFPNLQYFNPLKLAEVSYSDLYKDNWNLKNETLSYLQDDCKSLYEILL